MHVQQVPMQRGWYWPRDGFALWRRNPALISFLAFGYLLILIVVSVFPFIGQPLAFLLMPALSLGVFNGCRVVDEGRKTGPDILLSGFRNNVQSLLTIGGCYLVGSVFALLITIPVDGGVLVKTVLYGKVDPALINSTPRFALAALLAAGVSTPVIMAYWFAPVLAGWWSLPAMKALFFSFYACLRNWRPFLAFGVALLLFGVILPSFVLGVIGLVSPVLANLLSIPLLLLLVPIAFASFYINVRDVLGLPGDVPAA